MCKENRVTATQQLSQQLIRVGHSPDPDDAFMFYALAKDKIDTGDYEFTHELVDIETLNRRAFQAELELTAVSIHAYAFLHDKYVLCTCGASMGDGYGPMVVHAEAAVGRRRSSRRRSPCRARSPARSWRCGCASGPISRRSKCRSTRSFRPSSPATIAASKIDAGLIIHEGQLTYGDQDLQLVVDLGVWWQEKTGLPLPLGANGIRKILGPEAIREVQRLLYESIEYGLEHREPALSYALQYGRDLDAGQADKFVGMYVNDWTLDFGDRGREAVAEFLAQGHAAGVLPELVIPEFAD